MLEFLKAPSLFLQVSYYTLMTFPDDAVCNIAICVDYTTPCSKLDQVCDLW